MKRIVVIIAMLIPLLSCEKTSKSNDDLPPNFSEKILDGYFVKSMAFDNQGNVWIGTFKQGLIKYNSSGTIVYNAKNSPFSDTTVIYDIATDSKNNVWIAGNGLIKFDGSEFTLFNSSNTPIPEDFVNSIAIDSKDNIWFTSSRFGTGGVVKYDGIDWTVYTPENSELPVNLVRSITIDKNDNVWLALNEVVDDAYLVKISGDNWKIFTSEDLGFTPYYFGNIITDTNNHVCGAIDYSFSSSSLHDGPQIFIFDGNQSQQLRYDNRGIVTFVSIDNNNHLWCGAYGGYAMYDGESWIVDHTSFKESGVFAIEQAVDNKIWFGTGDGIYIHK